MAVAVALDIALSSVVVCTRPGAAGFDRVGAAQGGTIHSYVSIVSTSLTLKVAR
jgi:hypothetical protein